VPAFTLRSSFLNLHPKTEEDVETRGWRIPTWSINVIFEVQTIPESPVLFSRSAEPCMIHRIRYFISKSFTLKLCSAIRVYTYRKQREGFGSGKPVTFSVTVPGCQRKTTSTPLFSRQNMKK
jgi:hypothetical protein